MRRYQDFNIIFSISVLLSLIINDRLHCCRTVIELLDGLVVGDRFKQTVPLDFIRRII